jgi:hypothetical protein
MMKTMFGLPLLAAPAVAADGSAAIAVRPADKLRVERGDGVERPAASPPARHLSASGSWMARPARWRTVKLSRAVQEHGRAWQDVARMTAQSVPALEYQKAALVRSGAALDALQPHASRDLDAAFAGNPPIAGEAANGRTRAAIQAMQLETELRTNPDLRAERFVTAWRQLKASRDNLKGWENEVARGKVEVTMKNLAKGIEKDPAMGAALARRAHAVVTTELHKQPFFADRRLVPVTLGFLRRAIDGSWRAARAAPSTHRRSDWQ